MRIAHLRAVKYSCDLPLSKVIVLPERSQSVSGNGVHLLRHFTLRFLYISLYPVFSTICEYITNCNKKAFIRRKTILFYLFLRLSLDISRNGHKERRQRRSYITYILQYGYDLVCDQPHRRQRACNILPSKRYPHIFRRIFQQYIKHCPHRNKQPHTYFLCYPPKRPVGAYVLFPVPCRTYARHIVNDIAGKKYHCRHVKYPQPRKKRRSDNDKKLFYPLQTNPSLYYCDIIQLSV
nr:MAG TPA: hypothetical protein [Caudoviricetes sp.]